MKSIKNLVKLKKYLLYASACIRNKDSNVDAEDREDDTGKGEGCKFTYKTHSNEYKHGQQYQCSCSINTKIMVHVFKYGHLWCYIGLRKRKRKRNKYLSMVKGRE